LLGGFVDEAQHAASVGAGARKAWPHLLALIAAAEVKPDG
jgi:hypothetical protein